MAIKLSEINTTTASSTDNIKLVNQLTKSQYTVRDPVLEKNFELDLFHPDLAKTPEIRKWVNETFVTLLGGWDNSKLQTLSGRKSTITTYRQSLMRIAVWWANHKPNTPISQWLEDDVSDFLSDALNGEIDWYVEDSINKRFRKKTLVGRGGVERAFLVLQKSRAFKIQGYTSDGLIIDLSRRYFNHRITLLLKSHKISFDDWHRSEGWQAVPLPIAMLMLHEAIAVVRHKKTAFLKDYFEYQRSDKSYSLQSLFRVNSSYNNFCEGKWKMAGQGSGAPIVGYPKAAGIMTLIQKHYGQGAKYFPMNHDEINSWCTDVYGACFVIFLCLTGVRISEIESISADDYQQESDGIWTFKSELMKTNMGLPEVREMHGLVAEAAQVLLDLSYIDKRNREDGKRLPLFGKYFSKTVSRKDFTGLDKHLSKVTIASLNLSLKRFYRKFLNRHPEFEQVCDNIHAHRFRNTWAEFALRRFEGNVFESIRRHFRHSFGSYFTTHYVFGKLKDEVKAQIEEDYLKEIITRIAAENIQISKNENFKRDLYGVTVKAISNSMSNTIVTLEQIDNFVDNIIDDYERVVAHEYGYCIVKKHNKNQSNCYDKRSQTPDLSKAGFNTCSNCVNSVRSISSNKAAIRQMGITHYDQIQLRENATQWGGSVKSPSLEASVKAIKEAKRLLEEMGETSLFPSTRGDT